MAPTNLARLVKPVVVIVAATLAGCAGSGGADGISGKSIRYEVGYFGSPQTGSSDRALFISYSTNDGLQEQRNVGLPWAVVSGTAGSGFKASVKAQFYGFGTIICRITADDRLVQERTSAEGPYPTVECQA